MLECRHCDFLTKIDRLEQHNFKKCAFTGHVFIGEAGFDLVSYPCQHRDYAEFVRCRGESPEIQKKLHALSKEQQQGQTKEIDDIEGKRIFHFTEEMWHALYLKRRYSEAKK